MNKERLKGVVMGFILCTMLSATVMVVANTNTVTREITLGVRVNLNGQLMHFEYEMRPFVMDGRTFLPVRAISEALDIPVDFNPGTNTIYLGNRFAGQRQPLNQAAPYFDKTPTSGPRNANSIWHSDSATMGGMVFTNVLNFRSGYTLSGRTTFSLHNLNRQYRVFTGYIGRVDGSNMRDVTVNIIGDGRLLQSIDLRATDMPVPFSAFVEGVQQLRIEAVFPVQRNHQGTIHYAIAGFLE